MPRKTRPVEERFWSKVNKTDTCWLWTAALSECGYGVFGIDRTHTTKAHRFSYVLHFGPIPTGTGYHGTVVCHRCDTPACVRPDHLFLGSQLENLRDMARKGRASNQRVTHCPRGHEYTLENTFTNRDGRRRCTTCFNTITRPAKNEQKRLRRAQLKGVTS